MRVLKILGAVIGGLVVLVGIVLAVGIPGGLLTDVIQNRIERQTGYRLEIETTKISLRPTPTIALTGISLSDPQNRENSIELTVASAKAQFSLASLLRGKPHVNELVVTQPVLHAPLHRERLRRRDGSGPAAGKTGTTDALLSVGHVEVDDGAIVMADKRRGVENRLDNVRFDATVGSNRDVKVAFDAVASGKRVGLEAHAVIPQGSLSGLVIPIDFKLKAPGVLTQQLTAVAQIKLDGSTILIDALKGDLDGAQFSGNASVDLESKPLVKVNLDLARLGLVKPATKDSPAGAPTASQSAQPDTPQPWSDKPFDLRGLNYVDAQTHLSVGELDIGAIKIAPLEVDVSLADGIVRGTASKIGIYEGLAAAGLAMDASASTPSFALRAELRQVHALPLLSNAADFTSLDGKLDATLNVQAVGASQRDLIGNLSGVAVAKFQDGEIRGTNVARMIRALTGGTLSGWQQGQSETTDLTELSASFQIDHGQAQTQDFKLAGPLVRVSGIGTADLNTKAINFRIEPKLVMSIEGQGSSADPVGFSVPVMVQGPWNHPHIFLDMAGILDNPDAAYAQLRQLGQGLFGSNFLQSNGTATGNAGNAGNPANNGSNNLMGNIGALIQGLTGPKPNQGQTGSQGATQGAPQGPSQSQQGQTPNPAPNQAPSQAPNQAQGAGGQQGQGQGGAGQAQGATGQPSGQQAGGTAPGQPATSGGLGQMLGPQQQNQLDQIMHNLFGSNPSGSNPAK